jgi:hypothetical protein
MSAMKRRINALLALLFIITTLTSGLHELLPHHDSSNCQVCTLIQHDNAIVPETTVSIDLPFSLYEPIAALSDQTTHHQTRPLGSRAPPFFIRNIQTI